MSRRRKVQAQIEQAHLKFLNQTAVACSSSSKIQTSKFIKPATVHQKQFVKSIKQNQLTIGTGLAGSGKTLMALFTGVQLMNNPESPIEKLVYIRSAVDTKEEKDILGILPGGINEKLTSLTYPLYDNCQLFMDKESIDYKLESGVFEVVPMNVLRGRSYNNCFIILDECQNTSSSALKTALTRVSETSKIVIIGDSTQCDKASSNSFNNGLLDLEYRVYKKLEQYKLEEKECPINIGLIKFGMEDVVRSQLTKFAIELYDLD